MNSSDSDNLRRRYHAPEREAAASRRREAVVRTALRRFEEGGWSGTTIRDVAAEAGVSPKTVEAVFRTKAALLGAAVDYAIRGDAEPTPILQREEVRRMEEAETAQELLDLHAAHLRRIVPRSARIVSVVEHSAAADPAVAELWRTLDQNRRTGVGWAADTLLRKRDRPSGLERPEVEAIFWVAVNWGTYRTLAELAGLDLDGYEAWLVRFYAATLLGPR